MGFDEVALSLDLLLLPLALFIQTSAFFIEVLPKEESDGQNEDADQEDDAGCIHNGFLEEE